MHPEPGPYGPLPWSWPRPGPLWVGATLFLLAIVHAILISGAGVGGAAWALVWATPIYLALRGSRLSWLLLVIFGCLLGVLSMVDVLAPGSAVVSGERDQLIRGILLLGAVTCWINPPVRRFFDREQRGVTEGHPHRGTDRIP